jgi:hypothetical protein
MTSLEKYAARDKSRKARNKQRLKDALQKSMDRERSKGWFPKTTTEPLHPRTQFLKSRLSSLTEGHKAGEYLARAKKLDRISSPLSRGIVTALFPFAPGYTTVTGAENVASHALVKGQKSKTMARLVGKLLTKGKA